MSYCAYKQWGIKIKPLLLIALVLLFTFMGLFIIVLSTARIAYFTLFFGTLIVIVLQIKRVKHIALLVCALVILSATFVYQIEPVKLRVDTSLKSITKYFAKADNVASGTNTSIGQRLEVWRSTQYIFSEHPFLGIGNGNYTTVIKSYIEQGLVSRQVSDMGQAHNTFIEALISKGSIGLLLLLIIFYYPVHVAWKNKKQSYLSFVTVSTFASAITLMSTAESMLINKNNGVAYLLIFSAILFSSLIHEIYATTK